MTCGNYIIKCPYLEVIVINKRQAAGVRNKETKINK